MELNITVGARRWPLRRGDSSPGSELAGLLADFSAAGAVEAFVAPPLALAAWKSSHSLIILANSGSLSSAFRLVHAAHGVAPSDAWMTPTGTLSLRRSSRAKKYPTAEKPETLSGVHTVQVPTSVSSGFSLIAQSTPKRRIIG